MFDSHELASADYDDAQIEMMLDLAKTRSGALHQRRRWHRSLAGVATLVLVVALVGTVVNRPASGGGKAHASSSGPHAVKAPSWKLVGDVSQGSWQLTPAAGYVPGVELSCPVASTCYLEEVEQSSQRPAQVEITHDGGATWRQATLPRDFAPVTALACVDANDCSVLGQDGAGTDEFATTDDGGQTWTSFPIQFPISPSLALSALSCVTATSCVVVGSVDGQSLGASYAVATIDGGSSWTESELSARFVPVGIHCFSAGSCIATGFEQQASSGASPGAALYSTDGGSTWSSATLPAGIGPVTSIWCSTASDCLATARGNATEQLAAGAGVLVTTDAGQSWTAAAAEGLPPSLLTSIACATSSSCWMAGVVPPARSRRPLTFVENKGVSRHDH